MRIHLIYRVHQRQRIQINLIILNPHLPIPLSILRHLRSTRPSPINFLPILQQIPDLARHDDLRLIALQISACKNEELSAGRAVGRRSGPWWRGPWILVRS